MKKSILIIPGYRLFPIETGAGVAQFGVIDELRKKMNVSVLLDENNVTSDYLGDLEARWLDVSFVHWSSLRSDWEEQQSGLFQRLKNKLTKDKMQESRPELLIPDELKDSWENGSILFYPTPEWRKEALKLHLNTTGYDLVQTDLPVNLPLISGEQEMKAIHVCHELKHKRFKNTAEAKGIEESEYLQAFNALREREIELIESYEHCIFFNEGDAALMSDSSSSEIHVSPFPILDAEFYSGERETPSRLIFIGPESHGPNREGLLWFLKNVFSGVDEHWKIHVIGDWSAESIEKYGSSRVLFEGFVDDLQPYFEDSIMVVPILTGAGIRTKILQAMAQEVPVLATRFAAEGIPVRDGKEILFFDALQEFDEKILSMDDRVRLEVTSNAQEMVRQHFSQEILGKKRYLLLDAI